MSGPKATSDSYIDLVTRLTTLEDLVSGIRDKVGKSVEQYFVYPKWLYHPEYSAANNRFPPMLVHHLDDEEYYRARGYEIKKDGGDDFLVRKVTEMLHRELRVYESRHRECLAKIRNLEDRLETLQTRVFALENPEDSERQEWEG